MVLKNIELFSFRFKLLTNPRQKVVRNTIGQKIVQLAVDKVTDDVHTISGPYRLRLHEAQYEAQNSKYIFKHGAWNLSFCHHNGTLYYRWDLRIVILLMNLYKQFSDPYAETPHNLVRSSNTEDRSHKCANFWKIYPDTVRYVRHYAPKMPFRVSIPKD